MPRHATIADAGGRFPVPLGFLLGTGALRARGFDVTLRETSGGHDPHNWATSLADGLAMFLAP